MPWEDETHAVSMELYVIMHFFIFYHNDSNCSWFIWFQNLVQTTIWILVHCGLFLKYNVVFVSTLKHVNMKILYKQHKRDRKPLKPEVRTTLNRSQYLIFDSLLASTYFGILCKTFQSFSILCFGKDN